MTKNIEALKVRKSLVAPYGEDMVNSDRMTVKDLTGWVDEHAKLLKDAPWRAGGYTILSAISFGLRASHLFSLSLARLENIENGQPLGKREKISRRPTTEKPLK